MAEHDEDALSVMVELALSNAKRVRREAGDVVVDLARIRDYIDEQAQSQEDTANERDTETNGNGSF